MKLALSPLTRDEIVSLRRTYGNYIKITADLEKRVLVAGGELHADGEKILLKGGSRQDNIWGGGVHLKEKEIDTLAVLNLRPKLDNNSLEILDPKRRQKLINIARKFFAQLWN